MGQRPSEELELVATRIPAIVARKLQGMADAEGRATSSLARVIIENFFYVSLPPQMRTALEEDEKRLGMNRRDYINHLLFEPEELSRRLLLLRRARLDRNSLAVPSGGDFLETQSGNRHGKRASACARPCAGGWRRPILHAWFCHDSFPVGRSCTYRQPKRPLMQRLPRVTE